MSRRLERSADGWAIEPDRAECGIFYPALLRIDTAEGRIDRMLKKIRVNIFRVVTVENANLLQSGYFQERPKIRAQLLGFLREGRFFLDINSIYHTEPLLTSAGLSGLLPQCPSCSRHWKSEFFPPGNRPSEWLPEACLRFPRHQERGLRL